MANDGGLRMVFEPSPGRPKKDTEWAKWWLTGGVGVAPVVLALVAAEVTVPPLAGFFVWAAACAAVVRGLWLLGWWRWFTVLLGAGTVYVAFSLWQATSPHGEVEIVLVQQVPKANTKDLIALWVGFKNNGDSPVTFRFPAYLSRLLLAKSNNIQISRPAEELIYEQVTREPGRGDEDLMLGAGDSTRVTLQMRVSEDERKAYDAGKAMVLWVVQIRYRDWWRLKPRVTELCQYIPVGGDRPLCASHNGPQE